MRLSLSKKSTFFNDILLYLNCSCIASLSSICLLLSRKQQCTVALCSFHMNVYIRCGLFFVCFTSKFLKARVYVTYRRSCEVVYNYLVYFSHIAIVMLVRVALVAPNSERWLISRSEIFFFPTD